MHVAGASCDDVDEVLFGTDLFACNLTSLHLRILLTISRKDSEFGETRLACQR
jgi:hypothetical protein